jgi:hypothetical protein
VVIYVRDADDWKVRLSYINWSTVFGFIFRLSALLNGHDTARPVQRETRWLIGKRIAEP